MGKSKNCKISHLITPKVAKYDKSIKISGVIMGLKIQRSLCVGELTKNVQLLCISEFHCKKAKLSNEGLSNQSVV